jgi:hypothetical protein
VITNFIRNTKDKLVLQAFRQACSDKPSERTIYYDALMKISELPERNEVMEAVKELSNEGKLIRKLNGWTIFDQQY